MSEEKKSSEKVGMIFQQIPLIMADVKAIGKEQRNVQQGFQFRGIDDVYNELQKHLAKHKVFSVPQVLAEQHGIWETSKGVKMNHRLLTVEYTFYAEDGSHVEAVVMGEALDMGDKAASKALAIAHKYALFQVFCIPTDDASKDPDQESHEATKKNGAGQKQKQQQQQQQRNGQDEKRGMIAVPMNIKGKMVDVDYYEVLDWFKKAKAELNTLTGSDSAYYDVLGGHGFDKSNRIPKDKMNQVFQDLKERFRTCRDELAEDQDEEQQDEESPTTSRKTTTDPKKAAGGDGEIPF